MWRSPSPDLGGIARRGATQPEHAHDLVVFRNLTLPEAEILCRAALIQEGWDGLNATIHRSFVPVEESFLGPAM